MFRDCYGNTPLHLAVKKNSEDLAELLLQKGAEVNVRNNYDSTPLRLAAIYHRPDIADLLRRHGAKE
ncbi:MAG: ankyrin repeat domain-containing protein [Vulcanimicrobiota bacterium]